MTELHRVLQRSLIVHAAFAKQTRDVRDEKQRNEQSCFNRS